MNSAFAQLENIFDTPTADHCLGFSFIELVRYVIGTMTVIMNVELSLRISGALKEMLLDIAYSKSSAR